LPGKLPFPEKHFIPEKSRHLPGKIALSREKPHFPEKTAPRKNTAICPKNYHFPEKQFLPKNPSFARENSRYEHPA